MELHADRDRAPAVGLIGKQGAEAAFSKAAFSLLPRSL